MKIPEPLRVWWHDGAGVRVLRAAAEVQVVMFSTRRRSMWRSSSVAGKSRGRSQRAT